MTTTETIDLTDTEWLETIAVVAEPVVTFGDLENDESIDDELIDAWFENLGL